MGREHQDPARDAGPGRRRADRHPPAFLDRRGLSLLQVTGGGFGRFVALARADREQAGPVTPLVAVEATRRGQLGSHWRGSIADYRVSN